MDRFKSRSGCYLHGKLRRSDFLPVGEEQEDEILQRGYYSLSSDDEEGRDIEHAFGDQASEPEDANDRRNTATRGICSRSRCALHAEGM